jgi:tetratricopeptide (TPR) repeat protein
MPCITRPVFLWFIRCDGRRMTAPSSEPASLVRGSRRTWAIVASVLVASAIGIAGVRVWNASRAAEQLPPAPDLTGRPAAIVAHVRGAYEAARRQPSSPAAVGALCTAYHADLLFDDAVRCYDRVAQLDEAWRWAYARALIDIELGGAPGLADRLRAVAARAPTFAPAWLRLGDAEFKAARYEEAADAWRRAAALPEPSPPAGVVPPHLPEVALAAYASFGLARIDLVRGDVVVARERLERVVQTSPAFGPAVRLLADTYRALGRGPEAERAIYRAGRLPAYSPFVDPVVDELTRESRNGTLLLRVASEATLTVNAAWSEYLARRAVRFDPDNPDATVKLARVLRTLDRNEEALGHFLRYAKQVPGDYLALAHIGSCLSALGRYGEAETYLRRSLAGLDDATTHYNLGLLMARTGRLADAEREYRRALAIDPGQADARGNLAPVLVRMGRVDDAAHELRQLVSTDPENAAALTNLGVVLLQQGNVDEARLYLTEALRIAPGMPQAIEALRVIGR